jgi:hypothetical protein
MSPSDKLAFRDIKCIMCNQPALIDKGTSSKGKVVALTKKCKGCKALFVAELVASVEKKYNRSTVEVEAGKKEHDGCPARKQKK